MGITSDARSVLFDLAIVSSFNRMKMKEALNEPRET